ncbi:DUF3732 domain-containing protein [Hymenobacter jejuensis]|uniref:DUF3732 domain-containing protein n=1 Tax=Hymenobacter jejuensis TaxID=2502781 RepID=A0A5B7ZV00_9BACT|nr:DUF3732 domain-containing protein [Hymenobacter jejuensis]QDA59024.1 DUF3732 domain-containing protein [Hymenobacter jejuensis]
MNMQIRSLLLYGKGIERPRVIPFETGKVNIVTGESGTGKSSIIHIIDYCLGRSTFNVFEGVNRDVVMWYGVVLQIEQQQAIIVKPAPEGLATSQSRAYWDVASTVTVPDHSQLVANSNDTAVNESLSRLVGITENQTVVAEHRTTQTFEATFAHTKYYLFQDQGTVANQKLLFWRQADDYISTHIKDTMKYFLGAIQEERLRLEQELRLEMRKLKTLQQKQRAVDSFVTQQQNAARNLYAEAIAVGMVQNDVLDSELLKQLQVLARWSAQDVVGPEGTPLAEAQEGARVLRQAASEKRRQITDAENLISTTNGYVDQAYEQALRLNSVQAYSDGAVDAEHCPLCEQTMDQPTAGAQALNNAMRRLNVSMAGVEQDRARVEKFITGLRDELSLLNEQVRASEERARVLLAAQTAANGLHDSNVKAARVAGRISHYLDTVEEVAQDDTLERQIKIAQLLVNDLAEKLEAEQVEDVMASIINVLGNEMTQWARQLELEHIRDFPETRYRLNYRALTVVADTPERPITMERMGSAANWLGCHLIALLALHKYFISKQRPVPNFLILDQPSQVYFPSPQAYKELSGKVEETEVLSTDIQAVERIFDLLFRVVQELAPNLQIIVLEHANLKDPRYQDALVEEPWGKGGLALIPYEWIPAK